LDEFSKNRTTVTIAHRLATIKNSDIIFVLNLGQVVEQGTHDELMNLGNSGYYYKLVSHQFGVEKEKENEEEEENEEKIMQEEKITKNQMSLVEESVSYSKVKPSSSEDIEIFRFRDKNSSLENLDGKEKKADPPSKLRDMWRDIKGKRGILFMGFFWAAVTGATNPIMGYWFSDMMNALQDIMDDKDGAFDDIVKFLIYFLILGVIGIISNWLMVYYFIDAGEHLTIKIRRKCYEKLMGMDMGFYDLEENNPSEINHALSEHCKQLNKMITSVLGVG